MGIYESINIANERNKKYEPEINNEEKIIAVIKAKYIGGHSEIERGMTGKLMTSSRGVLFEGAGKHHFFYIPLKTILRAESKTADEIANNPVFARYLAFGGFSFAFRKKMKGMPVFLAIDYAEYGIECTALFETDMASAFAAAVSRTCEEYAEQNKTVVDKEKEQEPAPLMEHKSVSELMIDISELYARGILTMDEFLQKKRDLLSRI